MTPTEALQIMTQHYDKDSLTFQDALAVLRKVAVERDNIASAAKSQPLKTEALKRAIQYHRGCTRSCDKHGLYVVVGVIPNESCQVCELEAERDALKAELGLMTRALGMSDKLNDALAEQVKAARDMVLVIQRRDCDEFCMIDWHCPECEELKAIAATLRAADQEKTK